MNDTTEEPVTISKKVTVETKATLGGLASLFMRLPDEVPHEAEITDALTYLECNHEEGEAHHGEPTPKLALTLEWSDQ